MAKANKAGTDRQDGTEKGQKDEQDRNENYTPGHSAGVTGTESQAAVAAGRLEGPDADQRRRDEQKKDAQERATLGSASDALRQERMTALDRLEAEIKRHDVAFEDVCNGLMAVRPEISPQRLHDLRLGAIRAVGDRMMAVADLHAHADKLAQYTFTNATAKAAPSNPDEAPAPGKDDGGSA